MRSLVRSSLAKSVLSVIFLGQVLPSACLPTTIPGEYVTEYSNGQVQVLEPPTSTTGASTALLGLPLQVKSGESDPSTKGLPGIASPTTTGKEAMSADASTGTKSTSPDLNPTATPGATKGSAQSKVSPSDKDLSATTIVPLEPHLQASTSSSIAATSGASSRIRPAALSETNAPNSLHTALASTGTTGSAHDAALIPAKKSGSEDSGPSSEKNHPVASVSSTGTGALTVPTLQSEAETPSRLDSYVSPTQSPSMDGSSAIPKQSAGSAPEQDAPSTTSLPLGAEPSLDGLFGATSTPMQSVSGLPLLSPDNKNIQGTKTHLGDTPTLNGGFPNVPTATWTTAPPNVRLEVTTNPAWTVDTLVTTTIPGSTEPTAVPVFVNCDGCGPGGSLVVLGSFRPGISYNIPKIPRFPSIPRFHLPCIAFCPSPRRPSPGGPPPKPGPPQREDSNDDKKDDKSGKDAQDHDDDEQQTTSPQTAEATSSPSSSKTGRSSSRPSSTGSSTSSGTGITAITDTALIDARPTVVIERSADMDQYLLAAYSSLGIADDQSDSAPIPTMTTVRTSQSGSMSTTRPTVSSSSPAPSISSVSSTSSSSISSAVPSPTKDTPVAGEDKDEEDPRADAPDPLYCHGVNGDIWMIHRDQAVSAAQQFCEQGIDEKEYFQGSVDYVKLHISNAISPSIPISSISNATCISAFKTIIDSCDGSDPSSNPHNYKFGGRYADPNPLSGWAYTLTPLAHKPIENSCDVTYRFTADEFEIRGRNFPDAKLGANGQGLKREIMGCGPLTFWEFRWTPMDVEYQWYANGWLPVGTKSCVGAATQSAGGKSAGRCRGAG
ncbi:MAG: hypothetical protein Q9168_003282 [Polycauliona sp. 1 TL-2023]